MDYFQIFSRALNSLETGAVVVLCQRCSIVRLVQEKILKSDVFQAEIDDSKRGVSRLCLRAKQLSAANVDLVSSHNAGVALDIFLGSISKTKRIDC